MLPGPTVAIEDERARSAFYCSAPAELASSDAAGIVPDQTPEAAKSRNATAKDDASLDISEGILDLISKTRGQKPERFAATYVQADDLAELGSSSPTLRTSRSVAPFAATTRSRLNNQPQT